MDIRILIERDGIRDRIVTESQATRIPGIHWVHWHGPQTRMDRGQEYFSLTHRLTGRALNTIPLTLDESERLLDALIECGVEWDRIVDGESGIKWYADKLSGEAMMLAGRY